MLKDDLSYMTDEEVILLWSVADEMGRRKFADKCLDEIARRFPVDVPVAVVHDVPKRLERALPAVLWHQKAEGEGRGRG